MGKGLLNTVLCELTIRELFLSILPAHTHLRISKRNAKLAKEIAELAEKLLEAKRQEQNMSQKTERSGDMHAYQEVWILGISDIIIIIITACTSETNSYRG